VIVYAWVNDENTLRKAGSKTDPCAVFRTMLDAGNPPGTMAELLAVSAKIQMGHSSRQQSAAKPEKKRKR
jgi:toxin YhaV